MVRITSPQTYSSAIYYDAPAENQYLGWLENRYIRSLELWPQISLGMFVAPSFEGSMKNKKMRYSPPWQPFWKWNIWKSTGFCPNTSIVLLRLQVDVKNQTWVKSPKTQKSNMTARHMFWKWRRWNSICFYPYSHVKIVLLKFGVGIQTKLKLVRKPKNPIWSSVGHIKNDMAENQWASTNINRYCASEVRSWYSKLN